MILNMLEDVPHQCPIIKDLVDISVGQVFKGLPWLHVTLWQLRDVFCTDKDSFPPSDRKWQDRLVQPQYRPTSSVGKNGCIGMPKRDDQTMPYLTLN